MWFFSLSRSHMYGKCIRSDAGTSSLLVTVSGSSMRINLANSEAWKVCVFVCKSIISGIKIKEKIVKNSQKKGTRDKWPTVALIWLSRPSSSVNRSHKLAYNTQNLSFPRVWLNERETSKRCSLEEDILNCIYTLHGLYFSTKDFFESNQAKMNKHPKTKPSFPLCFVCVTMNQKKNLSA